MTTCRPRERRSLPKLEAVRPLPNEETTPPVTKICLVMEFSARTVRIEVLTMELQLNTARTTRPPLTWADQRGTTK